MSTFRSFLKRHLLFFLLIPIIILSQIILLAPHLKYGFSDVDWGYLLFYKQTKLTRPNLIDNFVYTFNQLGVYAHQSYYIGFIYEFFGLDYLKFKSITNIFRILTIISTYPLYYIISKSRLIAIIGVILFAFSYPAVGTMYTTVTSSDYIGVFTGLIFLWLYFYLLKNKKDQWYLMMLLFFLLHLTLFLATERMNPILIVLFLIEVYSYLKNHQLKIIRWIALFLPSILLVIIRPRILLGFFGANGISLFIKIAEGNLNLILTPLIALGSLIIPHDKWRYLGSADVSNLTIYIKYFLQGPFLIFIFFSLLFSLIVKRRKLFIQQMVVLTVLLGGLFYIISIHTKNFEQDFFNAGLIGGYLLILGVVTSVHYLKYQQGQNTLLGVPLGILIAFVFIATTWIGADNQLIFSGVHRYLTVPALFICLFLGSLFAALIGKLWSFNRVFKLLSLVATLVTLLMIILVWLNQINYFFQDELKNGFGADDKKLMRDQLLVQTKDLSSSQPSLFYFNFSEDRNRGYYYDNTLLAGFSTWMLWHPRINFKDEIKPTAFWNNYYLLKSSYTKEEVEGFRLNGKFYSLDNFYAFKLKDKKIIRINEMLVTQLESELKE